MQMVQEANECQGKKAKARARPRILFSPVQENERKDGMRSIQEATPSQNRVPLQSLAMTVTKTLGSQHDIRKIIQAALTYRTRRERRLVIRLQLINGPFLAAFDAGI
jgi:hypothetical protein